MSDLISLRCENCGGKLFISENTQTVICESCNTSFLVKREAGLIGLETFAACPICHRNDKSQKISTISNMFQQPKPPEPPIIRGGCIKGVGYLLFWGSIIGILFMMTYFIAETQEEIEMDAPMLAIIGFIFGLIFIRIGKNMNRPYKKEMAKYENIDIPKWKEKVEKWKQLYYCQRDDIVYDINTNKYSEPKDVFNVFLK